MFEKMHNFVVSRLASSSSFFPISRQFQSKSTFRFFSSLPTHFRSKKDHNFTLSYLVTSCGLSPEAAARVSRNLNLKTTDKPNAVLSLLKIFGFSETHISECVQQQPWILLANAERTLLPKLRFFRSIGVPISEFPNLIAYNRTLFKRSLDKCLVPRYTVLKSILLNDEDVVRALNRGAFSFLHGDVTNLLPNVGVLRDAGVPHGCISYLVSFHLGSAFTRHSKFVELVKLVQEMGLDPLKASFVSAIHVLANVGRAKWESGLEAYSKWGWSHEMSLSVFRKFPVLMSFTEERITKSMGFLVNDTGWPTNHICCHPQVLAYSLRRGLFPDAG